MRWRRYISETNGDRNATYSIKGKTSLGCILVWEKPKVIQREESGGVGSIDEFSLIRRTPLS
jgi:hypothetical protein